MRSGLRFLVAAAFGASLLASTASAAGPALDQNWRTSVARAMGALPTITTRHFHASVSTTSGSGPPISWFNLGGNAINSPTKLIAGPDGNVWFIYDLNNGFGKISPSGAVTWWNWDNAGDNVNRYVTDLAAGPDGNIWLTLNPGYPYVPSILKVTPAGVFTDYTSGGYFGASAITAGPDGNMWFTDGQYVGKITMGGQITEYATLPSNDDLGNIVAGPDGDLWGTDTGQNRIAQISTSGTLLKLYQLPSDRDRGPESIVVGPDHNLWLTEVAADIVGKLTTGGTLTEYPSWPANGTGGFAYAGDSGITVGPDGNIWFTQCAGGAIAKITTAGVVTEYVHDAGLQCPNGIAAGSDGNIWFADEGTGKVGYVSPDWAPPPVQCVVPKVIGKELAAAKRAVRAAKCSVGKVKKAASRKPRGKVISQTPKPGAKRAENAKVNLVVSKGKQ